MFSYLEVTYYPCEYLMTHKLKDNITSNTIFGLKQNSVNRQLFSR